MEDKKLKIKEKKAKVVENDQTTKEKKSKISSPESLKENGKSNKKRKIEEESTSEVQEKKIKKSSKKNRNVEDDEEVVKNDKSGDGSVSQKFQEENGIKVSGLNSDHFVPITSFESALGIFSEEVLQCCKGFKKPTPIQAQCWPIVIEGRDIVAIAETGSGKTLAFTLPGLRYLTSQKSKSKKVNPKILVIAPTRELAMQTADICINAGNFCGFKSTCIYGGVPKDQQIRDINKGIDVLVATPGRLLDLFNDGKVVLNEVSYLVLDEADRMLDMGFERDIRAIIKELKPNKSKSNNKIGETRQTLMFSATWPTSIQALAKEFLYDPVHVSIGSLDLSANHKVKQIVEVMDPYAKERRLEELLKKYHGSRKNRVIVFALYKKEAQRIEEILNRKGWSALSLHGDKSQSQRNETMKSFKDGTTPLLIATDVAARGLDIPDVEYVINFTFPLTIEDYVHRIGRTGRAGKEGTSHTFFTMHDKAHAGELINILREANQEVPENLGQWGTSIKKKEHALYGNHFKNVDINVKSSHTKFSFDE